MRCADGFESLLCANAILYLALLTGSYMSTYHRENILQQHRTLYTESKYFLKSASLTGMDDFCQKPEKKKEKAALRTLYS